MNEGRKICDLSNECERVACLIHEFMDKEIDEESCRFIQAHLTSCPKCHGRFTFETELRGTIKKCVCSANLPPDLRSRICSALAKET